MGNFHEELKKLMDEYVHEVYSVSKKFPKEEIYGVTSQLRRAALSVILNYIEGFARSNGVKSKVHRNFIEISYGSLKESKYLVYFSFSEKYLEKAGYEKLIKLADKIGGMLWGILRKM